MNRIKHLSLLVIVAFLLTGCDPAFETTAETCANGQASAVRMSALDFEVTPNDDYKLYLEDILAALQKAGGDYQKEEADVNDVRTRSPLVNQSEGDLALSTIMSKLNDMDPGFELDYELTGGTVTKADNPLDFIENLISTTDENIIIEAFRAAKEQIGRGIASNDGYCNYTNKNIVVTDINGDDWLYVEFDLSYSPFTTLVQQSIIITELENGLNSATDRQNAPYAGFYQAKPEDYVVSGFVQPVLRQSIMNNKSLSESLVIDDGYDNRLGQIVFSTANYYCNPDDSDSTNPSDYAECNGGELVRAVAKEQCDGLIDAGEAGAGEPDTDEINETNKMAIRSFDLNAEHTDLKRIRIETDYVNEEVRIYASKYNEAIYDYDETSGIASTTEKILDPTLCEQQAILDQLAATDPTPDDGVRLTVIPDPFYDIEYELDEFGSRVQENGEDKIISEPIPAIVYQGVSLPPRKEEL